MSPNPSSVVVRSALVAFLMTVIAACSASTHAQEVPMPTQPEHARATAPSGRLGVPFGTLVRIEGTVVDGTETRTKELDGVTLLEVRTVEGSPLESPIRIRFEPFMTANVTVPAHGAPFTFLAYETGAYKGVPEGVFDHVPAITATGFGFASWVVVVTAPGD